MQDFVVGMVSSGLALDRRVTMFGAYLRTGWLEHLYCSVVVTATAEPWQSTRWEAWRLSPPAKALSLLQQLRLL